MLDVGMGGGRGGGAWEVYHEMRCPSVEKLLTIRIFCDKRRKIRLIECSAKCRYPKKMTCKGTLRQVFSLSDLPSYDAFFPLPFTYCIRVHNYSYSHREWGGGGDEPERRLKRQ
jgi:hypothetical protein